MASIPRQIGRPSPFGPNPSTPQYLAVNSPEPTPPNVESSGLTPTAALVQQANLRARSNLLLQGRREELLSRCNDDQRRTLVTWLHDYWMHSFVTAKLWGKGPQQWTAGLVSEVTLGQFDIGGRWAVHSAVPSLDGLTHAPSHRTHEIPQPANLCQWAIHHQEGQDIECREGPKRPIETQAEFDLNDQSSWTLWPAHGTQTRSLQDAMAESFAHGRFSRTSSNELPISNDLVTQAVFKSPEELALDSVAFAIISGNLDSVRETLTNISPMLDFKAIRPYHLAASFLDGGHSCCLVTNGLIWFLTDDHPIALNNVDDDGHTVLDSLMISVLRSHTRLEPADVSSSFKNRTRFPGEEKDICGRWDADNPAVRRLYREEHHRIPKHWKHKFCHSAVQAVCHSMLSIFAPLSAPNINTLSGLFRRHCTNCGLEMKLGPFHTLVMVAYYLAECGMDDETLFGAVACAVCLLVLGGDAALAANVSDDWFMFRMSAEGDECRHHPITAAQLMEQIPRAAIDRWKSPCQTGWRCLFLILQRAAARLSEYLGFRREQASRVLNHRNIELDYQEDYTYQDSEEEGEYEEYPGCFLRQCHWNYDLPCIPKFGTLWASIQTELLTYRKVTDRDPSISANFRMRSLRRWLEGKTDDFLTPLVEDMMMKTYWDCGWFENDETIYVPTASDVSSHYFMNLDVWGRATFIDTIVPLGGGFI
ncbi:hypothetical protein CMUS01_16098 [Colletotrichum musicola]|uniref:Clr5 domain-containing protein n=1 Tax=Colletotrichum musicola TaxID=2175873 RepID=A0A8H6MKG6_9PEZI|nr:hypothetical protein CMUS01_16098 [Colletotrichum musicola]